MTVAGEFEQDLAAVASSVKRKDVQPGPVDRMLKPLHRWVWSDANRRAAKLLRFALTEADGGRDIARAAELTSDALLRRLYLRHALDEQRHASLFRNRGRAIYASIAASSGGSGIEANWLSPGERGLDDLKVDKESEGSLLAFLHLSESTATRRFALYHQVLDSDPVTREVFDDILGDEAFHMNYTYAQLKRVNPRHHGLQLWSARLSRLWKGYLRIAAAIANVMGGVFLTLQYFVILPLFAFAAKRAAKREPVGWHDSRRIGPASLHSQY
ncbi:MAG TPA: ferritin-like domain-containing protein [Polyangiaceae bacterium]|jgi:rubrerythrin